MARLSGSASSSPPKHRRGLYSLRNSAPTITICEQAVAPINIAVARADGGGIVIEHFGLQHWVNAPIGLCAMGELIFACGLPGWAVV